MNKEELTKIWESKFDHIYLQHYPEFKERWDDIISELKRVGIYDAKNFSVYYSIPNPYEDELYEKLKNEDRLTPDIVSLNKFRGSWTFYKILCEAWNLNYQHTIVIHDDIRFLNDLNLLYDILINLPDDHDLCMFDYLNGIHDSVTNGNINHYGGYENKYYLKWYGMIANTISSMSRKFIQHILINMHNKFSGSDIYTWEWTYYPYIHDDSIFQYKCLASMPRIAIQCDYVDSLVNELFGNFIIEYSNKSNQYVWQPNSFLNHDVDFNLYNAYDNYIKYEE